MRRREFITLLGGAAAAWPLAARAQQPERMRRIGVLMLLGAEDSESKPRMTAFQQGLKQRGWTDGHNVRLDIRWDAVDARHARKSAAELVADAPDVIVAVASPAAAAALEATRTVPIVFVNVTDPVGAGYRRQPSAAGRQRHRICLHRIRYEREMAGAAQGDHAERDASGGPSGSWDSCRHRPPRRNPICGALHRGGGEPDRRA